MSFVKFDGEGGAIAYVDADKVAAITENHALLPGVAFLVVEGHLMRVNGTAADALIDIMRERGDIHPEARATDRQPAPF